MSYDSAAVLAAMPYFVTALLCGIGSGWVYAIIRRMVSAWTN